MRLERQILWNKIVDWEELSAEDKNSIVTEFTFRDPKSFFSKAVRKGYASGKVCLMNKQTGLIPFGLTDSIPDFPFEKLPENILFKDLYHYQEDSLREFFKVNFGIIKV